MSSPVAITGLGAVSAFGDSVAAFRDGLLSGRSAVRAVSGFDVSACRARVAAEVHAFNAATWIAPMKLRRLDPTCAMAIVAVQQALQSGGVTVTADGDDRTGVVLGSWTAGGATTSQFLQALCEGGPTNAPALLFSSTVGNAAASQAALEFKLRGPNITISQKEASGLGAIVNGAGLVRAGRADRIVAGGADHVFEIFYRVHDRFGVMPAGEPREDASRPFDRDRSGFVLGEGGFALLLGGSTAGLKAGRYEEKTRDLGTTKVVPSMSGVAPFASDMSGVVPSASETAPAGGIVGEILGVGATGAAVAINAWPQDPSAIIRVISLALADAGLAPADVDVVYASANSSPDLDRVEAQALSALFGSHRPLVTSLKGAIGECGASGAASCVAALACGAAGLVPPIAGLRHPAAEAATLNLATTTTALPGPIVLVTSIASGGSLFALVLRVG